MFHKFAGLSVLTALMLVLAGCGGGGGDSGLALILSNGTSNPTVSGNSVITATIKEDGAIAYNRTIIWTWKTKGGSQTQQTGSTNNTDHNGQSTYTQGNVGFSASEAPRRTITVTATVGGVSESVDVQFGAALPQGFIALSPKTDMVWADAKSYCANLGGKLPRVANSDSTDLSGPIDGFGNPGDTWPTGLPAAESYWTGTANANPGGVVLGTGVYIHPTDGNQVAIFNIGSTSATGYSTVCVP